jgi:hypothetical protein
MGCVQERVDSDFDIEVFYDAQPAAAYYAKLTMEPDHGPYIAHEWELTVLYDGQPEDYFRYDPANDYAVIPDNIELMKQFDQLVKDECQKIRDDRAAEKKRVAEENRTASQQAAKAAQKAKEKADRDQYEILKAKFED